MPHTHIVGARGAVIQGRFIGGRPRLSVVTSPPSPIQPRTAGAHPVQPRIQPNLVQRQPNQPGHVHQAYCGVTGCMPARSGPPANTQNRGVNPNINQHASHLQRIAQAKMAQPRVSPPNAQSRGANPNLNQHAVYLQRMAQAKMAKPNVAQPRAVLYQGVQPRSATSQGPVVQRHGNGEAFQLPANLSSFGGGGGQPLPSDVRQKMESFFGASFADVRVHVGPQASSIGALAFTQGSNLYFAQGQYNPNTPQGQQILGHELTHVVQQRAGRVRNPFGSGIAVVQDRSMEAEADRMGSRAANPLPLVQAKPGPLASTKAPRRFVVKGGAGSAREKPKSPPNRTILRKSRSVTGVVQRVVGHYQPGTLAINWRAMKGLSLSQMNVVQQLHDDPNQLYTIDQARQIATKVSSSSNPYAWDVTSIGSYATTDSGVQDVLDHFGHPTQQVVKTYDDLASRVGYDVGKNRKGGLTGSTINDLHQHFEASTPLHVGFNPFLNAAWTGNLDDYTGGKTGIPLYGVMRSHLTQDFRAESLGSVSLDDVLKQVSGKPSEMHHLEFKAHYPNLATKPLNLMLTERSESEKISGPGQHELMHKVASGNDPDKFNQLLPQFVSEYDKWVLAKTGTKL